MKKLLILLFVAISLNLNAQYITNHAKNINNKNVDGFYYHLPKNIIRLDFVVEKTQKTKGKYSAFAKEMLNTDSYIKENNTSYKIRSINVSESTEADPNYVFHISADEKNKDNLNLNIELTSDGIIQSYGYKNGNSETSYNQTYNDVLDYESALSEYNYITIRDDEDEDEDEDSLSSNNDKLSEKEIAGTIIEEIKNLRIAYFDLITGYQEVDYGTTINYMVEQIKELENEYLSLFLGKTKTDTLRYSFYIIPEMDKNSVTIGKFSDTEGFNTKNGQILKVNFTDSNRGNYLNSLSKDDIENTAYSNKIFYRNPANVTIQIMLGDTVISENRLSISQLGNIVLIPINKMKFIFDINSGQILSIIKE